MKRYTLFILTILFNFMAFGQATTAVQKYLKTDAKIGLFRHTYCIKSFANIGNIKAIEAEKKALEVAPQSNSDKLWFQQPFYIKVEPESEAQLAISAEYKINETVSEIDKKVYKKEMPYVVYFDKHTSSAEVIVHYDYSDGTPSVIDTVKIEHVSRELPWKSFKTVSEIEEATQKSLLNAISVESVPIQSREVRIIFPKVKIKDKVLKEEYSNIQKLLKTNQFVKAGQLCKRIYQSKSSPEASAALGLCYELVGNYPKAEEYIKPLKDFHMLSRIRKHMKLVEFANSIGYNPEFIDF